MPDVFTVYAAAGMKPAMYGWFAICMRHLRLFWSVLSHLLAMQKNFNNQPLESRCMSTVQLLTEIEMLAHADYVTGTLNSGIPYLVEVQCQVILCLALRLLSCWCPYCRSYLLDHHQHTLNIQCQPRRA